MHTPSEPRLILAGVGLQNALVALAVLDAVPEAHVLLLERASRVGGNHTWSFHDGDVPEALEALVSRIAEHRWPDYDVLFPGGARRVALGYASLSSAHLADVLQTRIAAAPHADLRTSCDVVDVRADGVRLADGTWIAGDLVIDARGIDATPAADATLPWGYQKFYGLELELDAPHGLERPCVMDATVDQLDGFRFFYLLPFSPTRVLVEDTVFSTRPGLDPSAWRERVLDEAKVRGWSGARIVREERGVLPMPWSGEGPALQAHGPLAAGYRGRWFHPATGFSFPQAARVAALVAEHARAPHTLFAADAYRRLVRQEQKQARFARFLNRLLFTGVSPTTRWTVFERFYRLPERVMARFYAGRLKATDRARLLVGRPPRGFSLGSALAGKAIA